VALLEGAKNLLDLGRQRLELLGALGAFGVESITEGLGVALGAGVEVSEALVEVGAHDGLLAHEALFEPLEARLDGAHLTAKEDVPHLVEAFRRRVVRRRGGQVGRARRWRRRGELPAVLGALVFGPGHARHPRREWRRNRSRYPPR